jgi:hypothetical protein
MSLKSGLLFLAALALSSSAMADLQSPEGGLVLKDTKTLQERVISAGEVDDPKVMVNFVADADGAVELYSAYVANGYKPLHAMQLTNWDLNEGLRKISPGIPEPVGMRASIDQLRAQYKAK